MTKKPSRENRDRTPVLGDLEVEVLELVWEGGSTTAKSAFSELGVERDISLNTVQSALERLYRKGVLSREKAGRAYRYSAAVGREALIATLINDVLGRFETNVVSSAAAILEAAERLDENALNLLEREIRRRKRAERSS